MASKQEIMAGRAFVRLYLKNDMSRQLARALKAAGANLRSFGRGSMMAGAKMAGVGAAIAAPLVLGMREFANFDAQMGNVATMLDSPDEFMPGFRQGIKDMSVEFGKSKDDLATGLYDILSATVPPERALERLAAATKLASAGNAEVGASVSVLNTLMDTYGDAFKDAGDASDFLFAIVKRGRTNLTELSNNLGDIIATAKAAGMSVEDMGGSVALLTRATGKTDSALTALQAISGTFLKPGTEGAELWKKKFGDAMDTNTLKTIGMAGVLERLSNLDATQVAKIFPNLRAIRGIFPAIAKMEGFSKDLKGMADRSGNVATAFKKIKGPLFYWNQGMEQGKNILLEIGEAMAGAIVPHIKSILAIGKAVAAWVKNNKTLVVTIGAIAGTLVAAGGALITFGAVVWGAGMALSAVGAAVGVVLSPIGLLVAALVGGAAAWVKFSDSGKQAFAGFAVGVDDIKTAWGGIAAALAAGDIGAAIKVVTATLKLEWTRITTWLQETWQRFLSIWSGITNKISSHMIDAIAAFSSSWGDAFNWMASIWNQWEKTLYKKSWYREFMADMIAGTTTSYRSPEEQKRTEEFRDQIAKTMEDEANAPPVSFTSSNPAIEAQRIAQQKALAEGRQPADDARAAKIAAAQRSLAEAIKARDTIVSTIKIEATQKQKEKEDKEDKEAVAKGPGGAGAGGAAAVPRGVALTATYSASAARIAGYQPAGGGPEEKMATGIAGIDENTKQMCFKMGEWLAQNANIQTLYERFLSGWKVT